MSNPTADPGLEILRQRRLRAQCQHWWVPRIPEVVFTYRPPTGPSRVVAYCKHCGMKMP